MPRSPRASQGGYCYHVLNRGNGRRTVFRKDGDFAAFDTLLREAGERIPVRLLVYCLIPNHFHLALWPRGDGDLSAYVGWLLTVHVHRYHQHYRTSGHVYQGRLRSFPIQEDDHLLAVLRYIERNPVRAGLVECAQDWRWSSAAPAGSGGPALEEGPVPRPARWLEYVNATQTEAELEALRECVRRRRPYGDPAWVEGVARQLGLGTSLRPRGRPRKRAGDAPSLFGSGPAKPNSRRPLFFFLLRPGLLGGGPAARKGVSGAVRPGHAGQGDEARGIVSHGVGGSAPGSGSSALTTPPRLAFAQKPFLSLP